MSRTIPISLQDHLDSGTTTLCGLIRIAPVRPGYGVVGITTLDRDVVYDDGDGPVTYYAAVGYTASNYVGTADFTVDNAETTSLFPEFDIPQLTEADIASGAYDYADYKMMLVNYEDLTQGHILYSTGTMGEAKVVDGLSFLGELRSLFQRYRQSIVERDSLTCRATFGSQAADSSNASTAPRIERFPCGVIVDDLWTSASVTQVGVESDLAFASAGLVVPSNAFVPGLVEWLTGPNEGRQYEVSQYELGSEAGVVTLAFPTAFPIESGDVFRIRPDCTKQWSGPNSCLTYQNRLNFRGEPFIPVGDAGSTTNPGSESNNGVIPAPPTENDPNNPAGNNPPASFSDSPVSLLNPDFQTSAGWTVIREDGVPGFTFEPTAPGFEDIGVLRWQSGPTPGSGFDFGDIIANDAVGRSLGLAVRAELRVRCTALDYVDPSDAATAYLGIQTYEDEACTIPIGPPARTGDALFSDATGVWRLLVLWLTSVPADRFFKLVIVAYTGSNATLEFDKARWNLDPVSWNNRGT